MYMFPRPKSSVLFGLSLYSFPFVLGFGRGWYAGCGRALLWCCAYRTFPRWPKIRMLLYYAHIFTSFAYCLLILSLIVFPPVKLACFLFIGCVNTKWTRPSYGLIYFEEKVSIWDKRFRRISVLVTICRYPIQIFATLLAIRIKNLHEIP